MDEKLESLDINNEPETAAATSSFPLKEAWERLQKELNRTDGDVRLLAIAVVSGLLSIILLLPFMLS